MVGLAYAPGRGPAWGDAGRNAWHYVPRSRPGVAWREMTSAQAAAAWDLIATLLSARGLEQARGQLLLERTLGELTRNERFRDPGNYALVLFGDPAVRRGAGALRNITCRLPPWWRRVTGWR